MKVSSTYRVRGRERSRFRNKILIKTENMKSTSNLAGQLLWGKYLTKMLGSEIDQRASTVGDWFGCSSYLADDFLLPVSSWQRERGLWSLILFI